MSTGRLPAVSIGADCGQPPPIVSLSGPSSIICTNSRTTKFNSSVVTTSSTPSFTRSRVGPSISSAPAVAATMRISGTSTKAGAEMAPEPTATAASAPA